MPRKNRDLSDQIDAIIREATARIVALLEGEREAMLTSVQQAVTALDSQLQDRPGLPEALRAAVPSASQSRFSAKRPPRDQWVRTADVVVELRKLLSARSDGLRIAELRELTQFSDMQLHRALRQLRDAGEVVKEGELRRTVYRYAGPKKRGRTRTAAKAKSPRRRSTPRKSSPKKPAKRSTRAAPKAKRRPPRAQWVSTDDVKRAAKRALRRRKNGLRMAELVEATGYSDKQLHRAIVALEEEGNLERVGRLRNMRYVWLR